MLAGHFGLAAIVKSRQTQLPIWALMLATSLLDLIFLALYLLGIEKIVGDLAGVRMDWSHSLVGTLGISLVAAIVTMGFWGRNNGLVIGAVVFSHWLLDFLTLADLAILPGNTGGLSRIGLGLWQWPWLVFVIELALALAGAYLYYYAAMQSAIRAEREEVRAKGALPGYNEPARPANTVHRQQARVASLVMLALLIGTLLADLLMPF